MKEENYRLIKLAQSGDKVALETLTINNKGLVWSAVRRFSGRGVDVEDLFQLGAIGLIKAINKFDVSYDVEFSTYAVPMIMGEIRRFLRDDGLIKVCSLDFARYFLPVLYRRSSGYQQVSV